jgi:hypothetical protein
MNVIRRCSIFKTRVLRHLSLRQADIGVNATGKLTEQLPPAWRQIEESKMKKMVLAAFAALGLILGTTALMAPADAAPAAYDNQASLAGGNG